MHGGDGTRWPVIGIRSLYIHTVNVDRKLAILADAAKYDASCASQRRAQARFDGGRGIGSTEGIGHLPQLRARRPLHLAAEDPAHQLLHLRLPVLRQPRLQQRAARALHGRRSGAAHARLLPAQLHRGPVPQLAASSAAPDYTMEQVVEVARVLREEHDFRGYIHLKTIPDAAPELLAARRPLRRPPQHQHRAADGAGPRRAGAREGRRRRSGARWRGCACTSTTRSERAGPRQPRRCRAAPARQPPRFAPAGQSTQMIVGADATDDRDHPRDQRRRCTAPTGCGASTTRRSARSPMRRRALPLQRAAAGARAPPVPGRLADALLRLRRTTRSSPRRAAACSTLDIDPKLAWALRAPRAVSGRPQPRAARDAAARAGPRRRRRSSACCWRAACAACAATTWRGCTCRCKKVLPFVVLADHRPAARLDVDRPARRSCGRRRCRPSLFD